MKFVAKTLAVMTLMVAMSAPAAFAVETGGAKVKGNVTQTAVVQNAINIAAGVKSKAGQSLAAIHGGSEVKGNVTQTVVAKNAINIAAGVKSSACQQLGTIGDNPACR